MTRLKKLIALALALVMVIGLMPATVFANGTEDTEFPETEVTVKEPMVLQPEEHSVWTGSGWPPEGDVPRPLDVAMNFKATET